MTKVRFDEMKVKHMTRIDKKNYYLLQELNFNFSLAFWIRFQEYNFIFSLVFWIRF